MESKICRKCFETKSIGLFYKHKRMADGHLNICQKCVKSRVSKRSNALSNNPEWMVQERERGRTKYAKYKYKSSRTTSEKFKTMTGYYKKFPEKKIAKNMAQRIKIPKGMHGHHWSYNETDAKDLLFVDPKEHLRAHCFMVYDQERMKYRKLSGELLDTKEKHIQYFNEVKGNP